jgi:hypothetical protein
MKHNEHEKLMKDAIDHRLSGLQGDPWLAQRITAISKGEPPIMKKRLSMSLVLAIAAILVATTALAAGLLFSPRYDASKLANEALLNKYGITDKMMTVFYREMAQGTDGSLTVTYTPAEEVFHYGENYLGIYTVNVNNGKAEAIWSHDGEDTSGGLDAKAWGAGQLEMMITDYGTVMRALLDRSGERPTQDSNPAVTPPVSMEEYEKLKAETRKMVEGAAKITLSQAKENAVLALASEHGLTNEQVKLLQIFDGDETYLLEGDRPMVTLRYHLMQGSEWIEKDGIYAVTVNLETGEVEDIFYDSGLASNG